MDFCFSRSLVRDRVYSLFLISFDNRPSEIQMIGHGEHALFLWAVCLHLENIELGNHCGVLRWAVLSAEYFYICFAENIEWIIKRPSETFQTAFSFKSAIKTADFPIKLRCRNRCGGEGHPGLVRGRGRL